MADPYSGIAQALAQSQQYYYQTNPYLVAANTMQPYQMRPGQNSTKGAIASIAQGIMRGGLSAYGARDAQNQYGQYLQGGQAQRDLAPYMMQAGLQNQYDMQNTYQTEFMKQMAQQQFNPTPGMNYFARQGMNPGGVVPPGAPGAMPGPGVSPAATGGAPTAPQPALGQSPMGNVLPGQAPQAIAQPGGAPSVDERVRQLMMSGQATDPMLARKQILDEDQFKYQQGGTQRDLDATELKDLDAQRRSAEQIRDAGLTVTANADRAGSTGSFNDLRTMGAGVLSFLGSDEQNQKLQAQSRLQSVAPDVIAGARSKNPGAGTMDRQEMALYLQGGPGADQMPEVNKFYGDLYQARGQLEMDRVDFKRAWFAQKQTLAGSDEAWQQYLGNYKILDIDQNGKEFVNKNRSPWRDFFSQQQGQSSGLPGGAPPPPPAQSFPGAGGAPGGGNPAASPELLAAMTAQESGGNPNAVSPKGAQGLMQIMPDTGRELLEKNGTIQPGASNDEVLRYLKDPKMNPQLGEQYINQRLAARKGNVDLALADYNAGMGNVDKYGGVPPFPETQNYLKDIKARLGAASATRQAVPPPAPNADAQQNVPPAEAPPAEAPPAPAPAGRQPERGALAQAFKDYAYDPAGQILQGITFNTGDEIVAGAKSAARGTDYKQELAGERASLSKYATENPKKAIALQLAGGLPLALLPGGAAVKGASVASKLGRASAAGAAYGGLYGAGAGGEGTGISRKDSALVNAGIGAVAGPVISGGAQLVGAGLRSAPAQSVARWLAGGEQSLGGGVANEAGFAALAGGGRTPTPRAAAPEAADLAVMKMTGGATGSEYEQALGKMASTSKQGGKLFLPEALEKPNLDIYAKHTATAPGAGRNIAAEAIESRASDMPKRVKEIFGIGTKDGLSISGTEVQKAAKTIIKEELDMRAAKAEPLFEKAFAKGRLKSEKLNDLLENPIVQKYVAKAKQSPGLEKLPANDTRVLQDAMKFMGAKLDKAGSPLDRMTRADRGQLKGVMNQLRSEVVKLNPALGKARAEFAKDSFMINELRDSQVEVLSLLKKNKLSQAASKVVDLDAGDITKLRSTFVERGQEGAWNGVVRSFVKDAVDSAGDGMNKTMLRKIWGSAEARDRLRALVGKDIYSEVEPLLNLEAQYIKGAQKYGATSFTPQLLEAESQRNGILKLISLLNPKTAAKAVAERVFQKTPNEELNAEIARILFDPKRGEEFLKRAAPYQGKIDPYLQAIERRSQQAAGLGAREAAQMGGRRK